MSDSRRRLQSWAASKFADWNQRRQRKRSGTFSDTAARLPLSASEVDPVANIVETVSLALLRRLDALERKELVLEQQLRSARRQEQLLIEVRDSIAAVKEEVMASKREVLKTQRLVLCENVSSAQVAMVLYSRGLLAEDAGRPESLTSTSYHAATPLPKKRAATSAPRRSQRPYSVEWRLFIFLIASVLNLVLSIFRARVRVLSPAAVRAFRSLERVCTATSLLMLGNLWDFIRELLLKVIEALVRFLKHGCS